MIPSLGLAVEAAGALGLAVVAGVVVHRYPKAAVVLWLVTIAFVPIWMGLSIGIFLWPATIVGILVLFATRPSDRRTWGPADFLALAFFVSCLAPVLVGGSTLSTLFGALGQWMLAYLLGRLLPDVIDPEWISGCIAVVFTSVAVLAIAEFVLSWNVFVDLGPDNALHRVWGTLQIRGGLVRAEGAFGHSIALGSSLALSLPFVIVCRFRTSIRFWMTAAVLAATVLTVSRVSMVGAVIALLATVYLCREPIAAGLRRALSLLMAAVAVVAVPALLTVFADAGSEAAGSAEYRANLVDLLPYIAPLGTSSVAHRTSSGELYFGRFQSIDSALIFGGLTYGWFALFFACLLLLVAVVAVVRRRGSAATISVVAQIPALATVALITQYSMFLWFVCGLAVAAAQRREPDDTHKVDRPPKAITRAPVDR